MDRRWQQIGRAALGIVVTAVRRGAAQPGRRPAPDTDTATDTDTGAVRSVGRDPRRGQVDTADARPVVVYSPARDGDADPGEVVWAWVPYEEDPTQGKDRPLLVIGHLDDDVAALQLTSRPRDDVHHHPLGAGDWDQDRRPSWVRLDRTIRLDPDGIRREGAVLDRDRFERVIAAWEAY